MPEMQKIWDRRSGDVQILGISMGPRDEPMGVKQFVELNKYSWQFIHDPDSSIMNNYQVTGIPSSFFIDKNGVIRYIHVGGADAPTLEAGLQKALGSQ
jgi:peroxiredoxin